MQVSLFNNSYNNIQSQRNVSQDYKFNGYAQQNQLAFTGGPKSKFFAPVKKVTRPFNKAINNLEKTMAVGIAKLFESKFVQKIADKTQNWNLVAHLSAFTGLVLSGFYMKKTLENDKLDAQKKRTLAVNQGVVAILSTIGAYTFDKFTNKSVSRFVDKFEVKNALKVSDANLVKYVSGISAAKKIMIFGLMYRFISPVFATPIANAIGNKLAKPQDKKVA